MSILSSKVDDLIMSAPSGTKIYSIIGWKADPPAPGIIGKFAYKTLHGAMKAAVEMLTAVGSSFTSVTIYVSESYGCRICGGGNEYKIEIEYGKPVWYKREYDGFERWVEMKGEK